VAAASSGGRSTVAKTAPKAAASPKAEFAVAKNEPAEFEISIEPAEWNPESEPQPRKKK
jgi:hypothetical protein